MNTPAVRIVLDTNIFIAIIGKVSPYRWIFDDILSGKFILCISNEILLEYQEILEIKTTPQIADKVTQFLSTYPFVSQTDIFLIVMFLCTI